MTPMPPGEHVRRGQSLDLALRSASSLFSKDIIQKINISEDK